MLTSSVGVPPAHHRFSIPVHRSRLSSRAFHPSSFNTLITMRPRSSCAALILNIADRSSSSAHATDISLRACAISHRRHRLISMSAASSASSLDQFSPKYHPQGSTPSHSNYAHVPFEPHSNSQPHTTWLIRASGRSFQSKIYNLKSKMASSFLRMVYSPPVHRKESSCPTSRTGT